MLYVEVLVVPLGSDQLLPLLPLSVLTGPLLLDPILEVSLEGEGGRAMYACMNE